MTGQHGRVDTRDQSILDHKTRRSIWINVMVEHLVLCVKIDHKLTLLLQQVTQLPIIRAMITVVEACHQRGYQVDVNVQHLCIGKGNNHYRANHDEES